MIIKKKWFVILRTIMTIEVIFLMISCVPKTEKETLFNYPKIQKKIESDFHWDIKLDDPYRNLENLNDSTVLDWLKKQNNLTKNILNNIPNRELFKKNILNKKDQNDFTLSKIKMTSNNLKFYLKRNSSDNIAKLYFVDESAKKERLLFDPTSYSTEKEYIINFINPSWSGKKVIIGLTYDDKEFSDLIIYDLVNDKLLPDKINNTWVTELGGVEWLQDETGFIYTHLPILDTSHKEFLLNTKAVLYRLGQNNSKRNIFSKSNGLDIPINEEDIPILYIPSVASKYAFASIAGASNYRDAYYTPISKIENNDWKLLYKKEDKIDGSILVNTDLYFITSKGASNSKICKTSLLNPSFENPKIIVDESDEVITDMCITNKGLFYVKTKNGVEAKLYQLENDKTKEIKLPAAAGNLDVFSNSIDSDNLWITLKGWIDKNSRYKYNFDTETFTKEIISSKIDFFEKGEVVIEEIEVNSNDGKKIPLSIIYKKGLKKDSQNRLLINAYGAYNWSNSPYPYKYLLHWVSNGGIYAVAHVRGGGEKGEQWYKGGFKSTKPNSWKDLIACTEYLINEKYVSKDNIAAWGASAGGITIGKAVTEKPDLFKAVMIKAGMLNATRSEFGTGGKNNIKEFGTVNDSLEFKALMEMDAYQHLQKNKKYPAFLLITGLNDSRISSWETTKFAARLQEVNASNHPTILKTNFDSGHGFNSSPKEREEELINILTFFLWQTDHPGYQIN